MNDKNGSDMGRPQPDNVAPRHSPQLVLLVILLFLECLLLGAAAVYLLVELLVDTPTSYPSAIAILVLALAASVWVGLIAVNTLRGRPWVRGAAVVWQVLQLSVGIGSLQGLLARPEVGWPLILVAVAVLILLFTRPVLAATVRRDE